MTSMVLILNAVFVDCAPSQIPDKYLYDCLAPYGRIILVKHLTIKGFPSVQSGTRMMSMVITKAIPAEVRVMGFQLSFRYCRQAPTCFACQEVGHTARDFPKSSKRHTEGHTNNSYRSKPAKASASAQNSRKEPALSGSSNPSSPSSSDPRDLCEKLVHSKPSAVTPVGSGEYPVTLQAPQPQSPLVEVVEAVPVATSPPRASQVEAGMHLQGESFDFSLEVPPAAPVVSESSSGWSKQFDCSVRCTGKDSLEIVVSSSAPRLGPKSNNKLINKPNNKSNGGPNIKSPIIKVKVGPKSNSKLINKPDNKLNKPTKTKSGGKSDNQAHRLAQPTSNVARECSVKSLRDDSSSSSASDDEAASLKTCC